MIWRNHLYKIYQVPDHGILILQPLAGTVIEHTTITPFKPNAAKAETILCDLIRNVFSIKKIKQITLVD